MGILIYDSLQKLTIPDRTLAHLEVVITRKLLRGERFAFTHFVDRRDHPRVTMWIDPTTPLVFQFFGGPQPLNPRWLRALSRAASSPRGLELVPEPDETSPDRPRRRDQ